MNWSRWLFAFPILMIVAGCNPSTAPTTNNLGSFAGEYGFTLNGNAFDSGTPTGTEGNASISPLPGQGESAVQLSISLFFQLPDGTYGSVLVYVPLINPQPQTIEISSYTIPTSLNATASIDYDSLAWFWFSSLPGGTITLTKFDTVNNLVSGTFNFTASQTSPTANPNNVFRITAGYFNDIPIGQGAYGQGSISADVDDSAFLTVDAGREILQATLNQGRLSLWGDGQGILQNSEIRIQNIPLTPGTYTIKGPINFSDTTLSFTYWGRNYEISTQDTISNGQLTITKCDIPNRRISGTFQFSGMDTLGNSVTITNGVINNVQWIPN